MQDMQETPVRPRLGRSPEEGNGNPLQYSCLENSMDRGAWWATVHGVAKSQIELSPWFTILLGTGPDLALWGHFTTPAFLLCIQPLYILYGSRTRIFSVTRRYHAVSHLCSWYDFLASCYPLSPILLLTNPFLEKSE